MESKQRIHCSNSVRYAVSKGKLQKPKACSLCHRKCKQINGHHKDYSKPLEVIWLCNRCHIRLHNNLPFDKPYTLINDILIGKRIIHLPLLKAEPFELQGLIIDSEVLDEREYFQEYYDWTALLKHLSFREREIIKLRYAIGEEFEYTLEEVGRIFKVTRERVRQVEAKAIRKLQFCMKEKSHD